MISLSQYVGPTLSISIIVNYILLKIGICEDGTRLSRMSTGKPLLSIGTTIMQIGSRLKHDRISADIDVTKRRTCFNRTSRLNSFTYYTLHTPPNCTRFDCELTHHLLIGFVSTFPITCLRVHYPISHSSTTFALKRRDHQTIDPVSTQHILTIC